VNIWIINAYGNLPQEGWTEYRTTLMANALVEAGHNVVWWVSNFEHRSKKFRFSDWAEIKQNDNFLIRIVPSTAYYNHISLKRIKYERIFCQRLYEKALQLNEKPEIVIVGEPALFTSDIILKLIRTINSKLIVDIIDLWPELFRILLPKFIRKFDRYIFFPFYYRRKRFLESADAIIAVSKDYLKVGLDSCPTNNSSTIYLGLNEERLKMSYSPKRIKQIFERYDLPLKNRDNFFVIYAGTLGDNYDIISILNAAKKLNEESNSKFKIIIAGDGPLKHRVEKFIREFNLNNVFFIGRIDNDTLFHIYSKCDVGLCTYVKDSTVSIPMKFYDYSAASLPILSSLSGEISEFIEKKNIGLNYDGGNSESLRSKLIELSNDKNRLDQMRQNFRKLSYSLTYEKQYSKLIHLINKFSS
jgi:glycosyltransferase involved in cell wall biosynthesis